MELLNVHLLAIDEVRFKVIVESIIGGDAVADSTLPFDRWRITLIKALEVNEFRASAFPEEAEQEWMAQQGWLSHDLQSFHPSMLTRIGQRIYDALFPIGEVRDALQRALSHAEAKETQLHIQLKFNATEHSRLHDYPWELAHDGQKFLVHHQIRFSRYIAHLATVPRLSSVQQLRVLLVSSGASDEVNKLLPLSRKEQKAVLRGLEKAQEEKHIQVDVLEVASLKRLRSYLTEYQPHIFHFDGHGFFGRRCNKDGCRTIHQDLKAGACKSCGADLPEPQGHLLFETEDDEADYVSAIELGELLQKTGFTDSSDRQGGIAVAVLSACKSGMALGGISVFNGLAQRLISHRLPAVVAMQYSVRVDSATQFAEQFYRSLGRKNALATAVSQGQEAMGAEGNQWYRPVLYLRWQDHEGGQLFAVDQDESNHLEQEELLGRYLCWLVEQNRELELPGLPGAKYHPVELETVYVALRGDFSNPHERAQSQMMLEQQARQIENLITAKELTSEQRYRIVNQVIRLIARTPVPISIEERDRPHLFPKRNERSVTLGEAIQQERRLVILGDPGSGKTTLCRWFALKLAQAHLRGDEEVWVPTYQVNPAADETGELFYLGATRIPILVRVAAFANAKIARPELRLVQFLGHHLGSDYESVVADTRGRKINSHALNKLFLSLFQSGRAVLLLDGLDEISDSTLRYEIVREIDLFIREMTQTHFGVPYEDAGIQVVVTSRIVGYQMAPLSNQSTHLTIEPMSDRAIHRFCDVWMKAIHRTSMPPEKWNVQAEATAIQEATELKEAIGDLQQRDAGDLASNPLLITILALIFRDGQKQQGRGSFPQQRVKLYKTAVHILIDKWRKRAIQEGQREFAQEEVLRVLVPLAAHIHETSNIGVIDNDDLNQILKQYLSISDIAQFKQIIQEEVGLLAARGEGVYGFLHLTFQEYLAGCWLVEEREDIGERILEKLSSPRWREPILMALGQLSAELNETELQALLLAILKKPDPLRHLVPRTVLLLVAALPEMVKVPKRVIEEIALQILDTYAKRTMLKRFPSLQKQLEQAFSELSKGKYFNIIELVLRKALSNKSFENNEQILAAASLARIAQCYSIQIARALAEVWERDSEEWNWSIDHALRDIATNFSDFLSDKPGTLRRRLLTSSELAQRFLTNPIWVQLGIVIYGGLDVSLNERIAEAKDKIAQIDEELGILNQKNSPQSRQSIEQLTQERAELDTALRSFKESGHHFTIKKIHRDSLLSPLFLEALENDRPPSSLAPKLWEKLKGNSNLSTKIDAYVALAVLREPVAQILKQDRGLVDKIIPHISRLICFSDNAVQSASSVAIQSLGRLAERCPLDEWTDVISATLSVRLAFSQEPASIIDLALLVDDSSYKSLILAETLQFYLSGASDDPVYNLAVVIDTVGGQLSNPPILLAQVLANAHRSTNGQWDEHIGWSLERVPPRAVEQLDILGAALDALVTIPDTFDFFRGWALTQLASLLQENELIVEAIIIAMGSLSDRFQSRNETLEELTKFRESLSSILTTPYPEIALLQELSNISDPYARFRGYLQLMYYFPFLRVPDDLNFEDSSEIHLLIVDAQNTAQAIQDASRREWAFEQLARIGHLGQTQKLFQKAFQSAKQISNTENRSRAYARLANYFPLKEGSKVFLSALDDVARISDERKKTDTLLLFRWALDRYPQADSRFQRVVTSLNSWNQAKVLGLSAPILQRYANDLEEIAPETGSLVLGASLNDLRAQFSLPGDSGGLWSALLSTQKESALVALSQQARKGRLNLTQEATAVLDLLIKEGDAETVGKLLPLVQSPDARSLPVLNDWLAHLDPSLNQYVHLLLAETGSISEQTLSILVDLLTSPEDLTRYRAALALHGNGFNSMRLPTPILGVDTILQLAQKRIELQQNNPTISVIIVWTFERIHHNNVQILETLIQIANSDTVASKKALTALRHIERISPNAWSIFLKGLRNGTSETQSSLLHSLLMLLARNRVSDEMWQAALPILRQVNREVLEAYIFVLDSPAKLVESANLAWEMSAGIDQNASNLALEAERIFSTKQQNLLQILQEDNPDILRSLLGSIGSLYLINQGYTDRINAASATVEKKPQLLEVLIDLLNKRLQEGAFEDEFRFTICDLLSVVAACAECLPNTFYRKVSGSSTLQARLREVIESHNTFPGRQSALVLLSYFYCVTEETVTALKVSLRDVVEVQHIALQTVERYREVEADLLPQLFNDLLNPNPAVAYTTARMLTAIARNAYLSPHVREEIVAAFVAAIDGGRSNRDVYLLIKKEVAQNGHAYQIEHQGKLDEIFYEIVTQLSGIASLVQSRD